MVSSQPTVAATRTWTGLGATNNWNDAANWSGNAVPGASDLATFDGTSAKDATLNVAANVAGVSIGAGYGGTITQSGTTVTVGATGWTQAGGTFVGGSAAVTVNGPLSVSGGSFTATTATLSVSGSFNLNGGTFDSSTGTVSFGGGSATLTLTTGDTFNNLTLAAGTKTIAAGTTLTVTGTTTLTAGSLNGTGTLAAHGSISQASTYAGGTATLLVNGTADQTLTGASTAISGSLPIVIINKPSGTLSLAGTIRTSSSWTYTAGTLDAGTSALVFAGGTISGSQTLHTLDFRATTSIAAGTALTATGAVSLTAGSLNGTGSLTALADVSQASTYAGGVATLVLAGSGAQTLTGASTAISGSLPILIINKPSGTLSLAGTIRTSSSWTYTAGTLDPGTAALVFAGGTITGSQTFTSVDYRATTSIAAGTTLTVTGTTTLTAGSLNGTGTLAAQGSISQASTYAGGTATLLVNGTADQTLTGASTAISGSLPILIINKPSGTLSLAGTIRTSSSWTYTAGTLDAGTSALVFAGGTISGSQTLHTLDFRATTSIAAGTALTATGAVSLTAGSLNGTGSLTALADVSQASTYAGGVATLVLAGSGAQTLTGASTAISGSLPILIINKPSGTLSLAGTIRTSSSWTYTAGTLDPGTAALVFAGGTITGSQTFTSVDYRATTSIAAGTTLTVTGTTTLTAGSLNGTGTLAAQGSISQASTYAGGTATLLVNGTADQTLTGASTAISGNLPDVLIDKPSGTLTLTGTLRTSNDWTYTAGTLDAGTSTIVFAGAQTITGSQTLADVVVNSTGIHTIASGDTLTVTGTLSLVDGTIVTGTLAALGDVNQAATFDGGTTGTLLFAGSGAQALDGTSTTAAGNLPDVLIDKPSGTLTLTGTLRTSNDWTYTAGTLDAGTSTVVFAGTQTITGSQTLADVVVNSTGTHTIASGDTLTVTGTLSLVDGTIVTGTLAALGDVNQAATFDGGTTGTLLFAGSGAQALDGTSTTAAGNLPDVLIDKPSGTLTLTGTLRTSNDWTYTAGTLDAGTSTVVFAGTQTITGSQTLADVVVNSTGTHTIASGDTLTVTGTLSLVDGTIVTGTLAALGDVNQAATFDGGTTGTLLFAGSGAQALDGTSTTAAGNLPDVLIDKPSGTLTLTGTLRTSNDWTYTAGTLDAGTSTVVFAGTQTITGSQTLADVVVNSTGTHTIASGDTLTVTGTLSLVDGTIVTGTLAALGDVNQAATFDGGTTGTLLFAGSGAQALDGTSTTAAGNLPDVLIDKPSGTLTLTGTLRTSNDWTYTAGTLDAGTSTIVFAGGTVAAAGMTFYDVTTNGGTTTLGAAMTIGHDLTVAAGTFTTSTSNHGLTIGGNLTVASTFRENGSAVAVRGNLVNNGTIVPGTSTLTLDGVSGQTTGGSVTTLAFNLVIDDPLGVTVGADLNVTGTLTLVTGTLTVGPYLLTLSNPIAGVATNLAVDPTSSLTVSGSGVGTTLPSTVTQLTGFTLNNANGAALSADLTITGTLTLQAGRLDAGVNTVVMGPGASVVRTSGWVVGRFQKHVPAGFAVGLGFEVGDATGYTPVAISFGIVTAPGTLTAISVPGDHPDVASSGVDPGTGVNRHWTVTNTGIAFDVYHATFTFLAGDLDASADPNNFIVSKHDGLGWTLPAVGSRTALSTQATGLASFSHFALGEPTADLGVSVDDGLTSVTAGDGLTHGYLITITNAGPSDATGVTLTGSWPTTLGQGALSPSQGTCALVGSGPDFTCDLGTIAAGASVTVSVTYTVALSAAGGVATHSVSVTSPVTDLVPGDNTAADATTVVETTVLVVTKDDGETSVTAGDGLGHAYTITVTNQGPSDADGLVIDDFVPAALSAGTPSADLGGDCSASTGNTIHCSLPASLAPGATWTITVPYTAGSGAAAQTVSNTATATSDENPGGVTATDATDVVATADLGVSVDDGLTSVTAGDGLTHGYLITITNAGPSDATGVTLTGSWPTTLGQGALSPSQGTCALVGSGPDFTCDLGTIAAGASVTVSVTYTVALSAAGGVASHSVSVTSPVTDLVPGDNTAADATTVVEADLGAQPNTSTSEPTIGRAFVAGLDLATLVTLLTGIAWLAFLALRGKWKREGFAG